MKNEINKTKQDLNEALKKKNKLQDELQTQT